MSKILEALQILDTRNRKMQFSPKGCIELDPITKVKTSEIERKFLNKYRIYATFAGEFYAENIEEVRDVYLESFKRELAYSLYSDIQDLVHEAMEYLFNDNIPAAYSKLTKILDECNYKEVK